MPDVGAGRVLLGGGAGGVQLGRGGHVAVQGAVLPRRASRGQTPGARLREASQHHVFAVVVPQQAAHLDVAVHGVRVVHVLHRLRHLKRQLQEAAPRSTRRRLRQRPRLGALFEHPLLPPALDLADGPVCGGGSGGAHLPAQAGQLLLEGEVVVSPHDQGGAAHGARLKVHHLHHARGHAQLPQHGVLRLKPLRQAHLGGHVDLPVVAGQPHLPKRRAAQQLHERDPAREADVQRRQPPVLAPRALLVCTRRPRGFKRRVPVRGPRRRVRRLRLRLHHETFFAAGGAPVGGAADGEPGQRGEHDARARVVLLIWLPARFRDGTGHVQAEPLRQPHPDTPQEPADGRPLLLGASPLLGIVVVVVAGAAVAVKRRRPTLSPPKAQPLVHVVR
mmetsp:Transcript_13033/g.24889  ORF Transcript_13033/g.24889 Transcript_13033/m.24889 type:complete len:390 (-) Transcript_13033:688-1857(-)